MPVMKRPPTLMDHNWVLSSVSSSKISELDHDCTGHWSLWNALVFRSASYLEKVFTRKMELN